MVVLVNTVFNEGVMTLQSTDIQSHVAIVSSTKNATHKLKQSYAYCNITSTYYLHTVSINETMQIVLHIGS